jgi:CheY-like chemotaxis protein
MEFRGQTIRHIDNRKQMFMSLMTPKRIAVLGEIAAENCALTHTRQSIAKEDERVRWSELHFKPIERFGPPSVLVLGARHPSSFRKCPDLFGTSGWPADDESPRRCGGERQLLPCKQGYPDSSDRRRSRAGAKLLLFMSTSSSPERSQGAQIFLLEDHHDTLKYLTLFLGLLGHTVQSARTIKEALSKISNTNCDILICDIGLPDRNGHELLRQMKVTRRIYAIAISGFGSESDIAKSKAAGFRHHVTKPFHGEDLIPFLDEAIRELAA